MIDSGPEKAIQDFQEALGPIPSALKPLDALQPPFENNMEPFSAPTFPEGSIERVVDRSPVGRVGVPIWDALRALKSLLDLLPTEPGGQTRLEQCAITIRSHFEKDVFPNVTPDSLGRDTLCPITYPRLELNFAVETARSVILGLLGTVDLEKGARELLSRELRSPAQFLESDDRGTIGGFVEPTGLTKEQQQNDWKLNALVAFLDALRRQPYAAVQYATRLLSAVAIPTDFLSVDPSTNTVTFEGKSYPASDLTCCFVEMLIQANGQLVSSNAVGKELRSRGLGTAGQVRTDRLKDKLPNKLKEAIKTDRRGSRLDVQRLLSHV